MKGGLALATVAACLGAIVLGASSAAADDASLFSAPGQRPGPSILYKRIKPAPQLTNTGPWRAKPILISGASAYRAGEFLYQDFLYDDHGARFAKGAGNSLPGSASGTYSYPTASKYANNAADLVELRIKPLASATAFRLTLNTLIDPELTAATVAIGSSSAARAFPHGANATAPAQLFLTWHGDTADLIDAASGDEVSTDIGVDVDLDRRQVTLTLPHSAYDPGRSTVRIAAGAGLWDRANDRYLVPGADATKDRPGGAGVKAAPTAFFNVAFRSAEPLPFAASWRDQLQATELADGDLSRFSARVDFDRLVRGVDDNLSGRPDGVPRSGQMNRILSSRFQTGNGGTDFATPCGGLAEACRGELRGRLQPYALYVPPNSPADGRYQLTLLLHSLGQNYNQYSNSRNRRQFGDRTRPSLVITPEGRGPDGFYRDVPGADTFEVWADVAARYPLDPVRTTITGYSMGGIGTFQFAAKFPDLFARAQPTVGAMLFPLQQLASVRWVPFLMWNAGEDELVVPGLYRPDAEKLAELGYRYELDVFLGQRHVSLAINDQYAPAATFLDSARVIRNPPRVTFVRNAAVDFPKVGTTADHAYWLSRITLRDPDELATVDVRSRGFGRGDPDPVSATGSGMLEGGRLGSLPFTIARTRWRSAPRIAVRDRLDVTATNVSSIMVDATRARVTCGAKVRVTSEDPVEVVLRNCPAVARAGGARAPASG